MLISVLLPALFLVLAQKARPTTLARKPRDEEALTLLAAERAMTRSAVAMQNQNGRRKAAQFTDATREGMKIEAGADSQAASVGHCGAVAG
jgi:hypothetical protein